jgi:putative protein-disulfide isomerase
VPVRVRYITDPACSDSWAAEPQLRRLMVEFGDDLAFTYVMGGLAREVQESDHGWLAEEWLAAAERSRMPVDSRLWKEGPIGSTYPASMAVKAAAEQAGDGGYTYLRALREGLMCLRRKLDTTEALVEEARGAGLDVQRFRIDLGSHAIVESFGADLEEVRAFPEDAREQGMTTTVRGPERLVFPSAIFIGEDGEHHGVYGHRPYEAYRDAALAAGAEPVGGEPPGVLEALQRFGRMAAVEIEQVCHLSEPQVEAELWQLALDWKVKPVRVLTGRLWEPA